MEYRILITTSRRPSPRTRSLVKDLAALFPGSYRLTRGHMTLEELALEARSIGADRVLIVGERRGNPSILRFYEPRGRSLVNIVTILVKGVKLSREAGTGTPAGPRGVAIIYDDSGEAMEMAEALMRGLKARLRPGRDDVVITLEGRGGEVLARFRYRDRLVGPTLRLARPVRMIKNV